MISEILKINEFKNFPLNLPKTYYNKILTKDINFFDKMDIFKNKKLALFCSVRCPGNIILETFELFKKIKNDNITMIGGFHSPMEKECLNILLRNKQPVIYCPARCIKKMRIPKEFKKLIDEGRLLIISPFNDKHNRATVKTTTLRNQFVAAIADYIFVAYAEAGGKIEHLCREIISWGKHIYTLDNKLNENLFSMGAEIFFFRRNC